MKRRHWLLLVATVCAVLLAIFFPQTLFASWDRTELNVVRSESIDETQLVTNYSISGADRLQLFCRSGIIAQDGAIRYRDADSGITLELRTLDLSDNSEEKVIGKRASPNISESAISYDAGMDTAVSEKANMPLQERVENYLYNAIWTLDSWGMLRGSYGDFYTRYSKIGPSTLQVEYCSITDDNAPFFSMALLCVTCTMKDAEAWGLREDTAFSMVIDEETGMLYAVSFVGDPECVLPHHPIYFMVLADLIGVSCTEIDEKDVTEEVAGAAEAYETRFNFGGYSFRHEQSVVDGHGSSSFNSESNLSGRRSVS